MWSKLNPHIWDSRNAANGGPDVPLFLAQDHVGSRHHLLKWTRSVNHKKDPTELWPTSLEMPKGWRRFHAAERMGDLHFSWSWGFQSCSTTGSLKISTKAVEKMAQKRRPFYFFPQEVTQWCFQHTAPPKKSPSKLMHDNSISHIFS